MSSKKSFLFLISFLLSINFANSQLTVTTNLTPTQYVDVLVGAGIITSNVTYTGDNLAIGRFNTGTNATNLGLSSGVVMTSGYCNGSPAIGSSAFNLKSDINSGGSDADLVNLVPGDVINNASVLEFDFIPVSDTIRFRYVMASEEYPDYVCSDFNDVFGFFLTGPNPQGGFYINKNLAIIPGTNLPVAINTINSGSPGSSYPSSGCTSLAYSMYYVNNSSGTTIVYDGFTTILTAWAVVEPCESYHIKLAIGDRTDQVWDSGVFLEENSFSSPVLSLNDTFPNISSIGNFALEGGCNDASLCFSISPAPSADTTISFTIGGSAINGIDYVSIPNSVTILAGQGSACVVITPIEDGMAEGTETVSLIFASTFNCTSNIDSTVVEIHDYDYMQFTFNNDTSIACGQSVTLTANPLGGITPYQYQWNSGLPAQQSNVVTPSVTTTYIVSVTDFCNNLLSDTMTIYVSAGTTNAGPNQAICFGESAILTAEQSQSYFWSTGETTQSISVSPTIETVYYLTVLNPCESFDSVTVSVNPLPIVTASVDPTSICPNESVSVSALGASSYWWNSDPIDESLSQSPTQSNESLTVSPSTTTTYSVTGTDANGCTAQASAVLTVVAAPNASFFTQPPVASSFNPTFHFFDHSSGSPVFWQWSLSDGSEYFLQDFIHQFPVDSFGDYTVILYVENATGCSDTIVGTVTVIPDFTIYIPNSFSPNRDGINDEFHIAGLNFPEEGFSIRIYDRWGQIVFVSSNPSFLWDGKRNGEPVPTGTYVYSMFYKGTDGNVQVRQGNITLWY